jgi:hypothetical protein
MWGFQLLEGQAIFLPILQAIDFPPRFPAWRRPGCGCERALRLAADGGCD